MQRQQLVDREEFYWQDRVDLMEKTDWKCACCGTPLEIGRNATLDHFVPLSKGGINQRLNIVPLCEDCNKRKTNRIVEPDWYLKHIHAKDKEELQNYFDSYVHSFEYVTRGNLLSCDMYEIRLYTGPELREKNPEKRRKMKEKLSKRYILERMLKNQKEEMSRFFLNYLTKYGILDDAEAVPKNIEFWSRFGVIYCMRDKKTDEIRVMMPMTIGQDRDGKYYLNIAIFPLYATDLSASLVVNIPRYFTRKIMDEQDLDYLRVMTRIPVCDGASRFLTMDHDCFQEDGWTKCGILCSRISEEETDRIKEDEIAFYQQFHDVRKHLDRFFETDGYDEIRFMGDEIIDGYEASAKD